jgi:hypothetical protein
MSDADLAADLDRFEDLLKAMKLDGAHLAPLDRQCINVASDSELEIRVAELRREQQQRTVKVTTVVVEPVPSRQARARRKHRIAPEWVAWLPEAIEAARLARTLPLPKIEIASLQDALHSLQLAKRLVAKQAGDSPGSGTRSLRLGPASSA